MHMLLLGSFGVEDDTGVKMSTFKLQLPFFLANQCLTSQLFNL